MKEAMKLALDALEDSIDVPCYGGHPKQESAAVVLRQAIEQTEQAQPVAWLSIDSIGERYLCFTKPEDDDPAQPLYTAPPPRKPLTPEPEWIVNDLGELGVKVGSRFFFLYKGDNIEYGKDCEGETALHDDGTQIRYRIVGKREFGETCWPLKWVMQGHGEDRYTVDLKYIPGLSFGKPEDGEWKPLPAAHGIGKGEA